MDLVVIRQQGDGVQETATTPAAAFALPTLNDGSNPRFCRVSVENDTSKPAVAGVVGVYMRTGASTVVVVNQAGLHLSMGQSVILHTRGQTHISLLRVGADDLEVHIVPVE